MARGLLGATSIAPLLAAIGVCGVVAHGVARRTREIGLRIALGATTADVVRLIAREGLRPAVVGTAAGLPGALPAATAIRGPLIGVPPVRHGHLRRRHGAPASSERRGELLPACYAMRVDPAEALRTE